jgi:aryl-alcohol dehydrogenase-like predicted oxidoreductase
MHYRELGKTGVQVSEVGLGCNRLGQDYASDDHWVTLVRRAVDLGVTLFDTAEAYGWGRSEEILGQALTSGDGVMIATKMCRIRESGEREYSADRMMETVEGSLRRLQREVIDIYQLHSPGREHLQHFNWVEGMTKLKAQGKIRFAAVAVRSAADGVWLIEQDVVDVLQITYNLFNTEAEARLFEAAEAAGVGIMCRMPLARGVLTGKFSPDEEVSEGHRALLDGDKMWDHIRMAEALRPIADGYPGGMTHMALHFSLTPPAVSAIIPGARTLDQLEENVAASNGEGLPDRVQDAVRQVTAGW